MRKHLFLAVTVVLLGLGGTGLFDSLPAESSSPASDPWYAPSEYPDRIVLTWEGDPATTQSVTWRTDGTVTEPVAQIAPAKASPNFSQDAQAIEGKTEMLDISDHGRVHYHSVTFTDLEPNTLYAYRVGERYENNWSEWIHFRTATDEFEPFSFIYFGDAQNGVLSHWSRAIRAGYSEAPNARFMIHAGDLINRAHRDHEWGEWFKAGGWIQSMVPSIAVPGNHEYEEPLGTPDEDKYQILSKQWRPQFTFPENGVEDLEETVYYIDYQDVRVVAMNSNLRLEDQQAWLNEVLADNSQRWTVVTFHHPVFSSGEGRDNPELRRLWKPLFDEYQVDLVLQGHDHTYGRGRNLPVGVNAQEGGTVYVVSVSGAKMYDLTEERWMDRAAENTQLYQVVHVARDTLQYEAYTVTGELYDAFDLVKQDDGESNEYIERVSSDEHPERSFENTYPEHDHD